MLTYNGLMFKCITLFILHILLGLMIWLWIPYLTIFCLFFFWFLNNKIRYLELKIVHIVFIHFLFFFLIIKIKLQN